MAWRDKQKEIVKFHFNINKYILSNWSVIKQKMVTISSYPKFPYWNQSFV